MQIKSKKTYEFEYTIQETDLDVFGHVNNANYLKIYELARWNFIERNGFGLDRIKKELKGPVLLEVTVNFRRELKNRDKIKVISVADKIEGKFMWLKQEMRRGEDLCSKATFTVAFFDLKSRKMLPPSNEWLAACGIEV